jgi:hypothetical protein
MQILDCLLTEVEAAKQLGKDRRTLASWRVRNMGPAYVKVGRTIFYAPADIKNWIEEQRVEPTGKHSVTRRLSKTPVEVTAAV